MPHNNSLQMTLRAPVFGPARYILTGFYSRVHPLPTVLARTDDQNRNTAAILKKIRAVHSGARFLKYLLTNLKVKSDIVIRDDERPRTKNWKTPFLISKMLLFKAPG
jgi:hypothetical protein